jgi:hypothetical protein
MRLQRMKVDRVGADRVGLCKLFRAVATVACHKALIPPPHLRLAFDQQDLSFITPHTRLFSCLVVVFLSRPVAIRHPYHPENHRASIPIRTGPDYSTLSINIPFPLQIGTIYTFNYVQTRCACLRFTAPITNLTCVIHFPRPSHPPIAPASGLYSYTCTAWYDTAVLI